MRIIPFFFAATALLTTSITAQADAGSAEPHRSTAEQREKATGAFKLSDGRRAEIFELGTRLYVRIGRSQQQELLLAAPNRFVSADGKVAVELGPDLETDRIVLDNDRGIGTQDTIRIASAERPGRGRAD
jgi:hypothetical protein